MVNTLKHIFSAAIISTVLAFSPLSLASENQALNINHASVEQLETIKGIGKKKAQAIIDYRTTNGSFESIEELTKVKGIGKGFIEKNKAWLAVN